MLIYTLANFFAEILTYGLLALIVVIIIAIIIYKIRGERLPLTQKEIGDKGEAIVDYILSYLNEEEFQYENNIYINHHQIDHIVIQENKKRIFSIETKNWGGRISGRKNDAQWEVDFPNGNSYWRTNPIKQNEKHIEDLKTIYKGYDFVNLVVFIGNTRVPKLKNVIQHEDLFDFIRYYD